MKPSSTWKWGLAAAAVLAVGLSAPVAQAVPVNISKFQPWFTPIQLSIPVGTTVVWTNNDPNTTHTVTSLALAAPDPTGGRHVDLGVQFDFRDILPSASVSKTFQVPGTYSYICIIHPWMAAAITVSLDGGGPGGPVPDILQGVDTQDMPTPDRQGVVGIGEWCTTATYEFTGLFPFQGVVHCGSSHLWEDMPANAPITASLETAKDSGVTLANGFPTSGPPQEKVACGNGVRLIGMRADGSTTTHNLWVNNHFTTNGASIGPNGTAFGNPAGSVIQQPARECLTFSTNLHGQTLQSYKRTNPQGLFQTSNTLFASDITHVMTNPGGTVGWVTMEAGVNAGTGTVTGHLGIFDPNNPPAQMTNFINLGANFPHGNWVCGNGTRDAVPAPLSNTVVFVNLPSTPTGAGSVDSVGVEPGTYPVANSTLNNCSKTYFSDAVGNTMGVWNPMTGEFITTVSLGECTTCTLMGVPVPNIHVPIQAMHTADDKFVVVQVSKASRSAIIDTASDTVVATVDCANGCHGSHAVPKLGGGQLIIQSAAYQDKMSVIDMATLTKVGDVKTNMNSLLGLQGTTPLGQPTVVTISNAVGWNSGTIAWPLPPPWK